MLMAEENNGIVVRGVSGGALAALLNKLPSQSLRTWEVVKFFITPMIRSSPGALRYVDLLEPSEKCSNLVAASGKEMETYYFVSHAWSMRVDDLLAHLVLASSGKSKQIMYWLDICVVAQTEGAAMSSDIGNIHKIIEAIGWTLLVLDGDFSALKRVWCIFEIVTTLRLCGPGRVRIQNTETSPLYFYLIYNSPYEVDPQTGANDARPEPDHRLIPAARVRPRTWVSPMSLRWVSTFSVYCWRASQLITGLKNVDVGSATATFESDRVRVMKEVDATFGLAATDRAVRDCIRLDVYDSSFASFWKRCLQRWSPVFRYLGDDDRNLWKAELKARGGSWITLRPVLLFFLRLGGNHQ
jgi:hypothetical protein